VTNDINIKKKIPHNPAYPKLKFFIFILVILKKINPKPNEEKSIIK